MSLAAWWDQAAGLVADHRDVLEARPGNAGAEGVLDARGWTSFLTTLDDAELASIEIGGHHARWPERTPPSLLALVESARRVCELPMISGKGVMAAAPIEPEAATTAREASIAAAARSRRRETPRKRAQIDAFARVILPLATGAARVVDVGSGHGHLTREIAERIAHPVVGLERSDQLAARARELSTGGPASAVPSFAVTDVLEDGIPLVAGDCVIGLHACGDLGDAMVQSAARVRASIALVGCCLQKRRARARRPLFDGGDVSHEARAALVLPRELLGLSNLTPRDAGVEATRSENLAARERRLALHHLLTSHGIELQRGAEIEGLNRRTAHRDLATLASRAFALRSRASPSAAELAAAAEWARTEHARVRRLSLPRMLLARPLEVFIAVDRARYLEAHGFHASVATAFPEEVSARNLVVVARWSGREGG